jgi:hypothetical protein
VTLGGFTNMTTDSAHGTQIEYLAQNGKAYLWYPGNSVILPGRWKTEGAKVCFAYGENTYNPATGASGGGWECMSAQLYWWAIFERMPGDVLGLTGRQQAPFRLDRGHTTLEKILARVSPGAEAPPVEATALNPDGSELVISCQSIIANAERSREDMSLAVSTYFHGMFMGKRCVEVDYARAFELARRAGVSVEPYLRILRERAADGHPTAIAALKLLDH